MLVIFDFSNTSARLAFVFWFEILILMGILWNWNPFALANIYFFLVLYVQNGFRILYIETKICIFFFFFYISKLKYDCNLFIPNDCLNIVIWL